MSPKEKTLRFLKINLIIAGILGAVIYGVFILFFPVSSPHYYVALFLGIFLTLALTVALMTLIFYSGLLGYDGGSDQNND